MIKRAGLGVVVAASVGLVGLTAAHATTGPAASEATAIQAAAIHPTATQPSATQPSGAHATGTQASGSSGSADAFVRCMRSHGVGDFPGVTIASDGQVSIELSGTLVDVVSKKYDAATRACASLLPAGTRLPSPPSAPSLSRLSVPGAASVPGIPVCWDLCPDAPKAPSAPFMR